MKIFTTTQTVSQYDLSLMSTKQQESHIFEPMRKKIADMLVLNDEIFTTHKEEHVFTGTTTFRMDLAIADPTVTFQLPDMEARVRKLFAKALISEEAYNYIMKGDLPR